MHRNLLWSHRGRVPYGEALELQMQRWADVRDGLSPPTLFTLEHDPVITLGKRATAGDIRIPDAQLRSRGIDVFRVERGGQATFHGPGQLVCYAIVDIRRRDIGISDLVRDLAGAISDELDSWGISAAYDSDRPGLWTDDQKIAAVGMRVKQGTSFHGAALNVHTALDAFTMIVPCGMPDAKTTRMADLNPDTPAIPQLAHAIAGRFAERLDLELEFEGGAAALTAATMAQG